MKHLFISLALAAAVSLGGCVSNGAGSGSISLNPAIGTSLKKLGDFTITDLQNADAIAVKSNDTLGHQCYPVLTAFVQAQQNSVAGAGTNTVSGAFSAFEAARTAANAGAQLISKSDLTMLESACGGLVQDTINTPANFMAALAGLGG